MSKTESLSILLEEGGKDFLSVEYGKAIDNIAASTISGRIKNVELSGSPGAGCVEAKRFANAVSNAYGTARAGGFGSFLRASSVSVPIDTDREIIEEIEEKDVSLYGVRDVVARRIRNHRLAMAAELEQAFFKCAVSAGSALDLPLSGGSSADDGDASDAASCDGADIAERAEALIQSLESVRNDFVIGVDRELISVTLGVAAYGELRRYLDSEASAAVNVSTDVYDVGRYHGARIFSTSYLPDGVGMLAMVDGSVAQPVFPSVAEPQKIPLSNAVGFGIFYSYGTAAVMPDLIRYVSCGS